MIRIFTFLTGICLIFCAAVQARAAEPVTIFAAASLRGGLDAALHDSAVDTRVSYGGSGGMARQIAQGAPADLVILANVAWMDWLEEQGRLSHGSRSDLLGNRLVIVGPAGAPPLSALNAVAFEARLSGGRLAVGQTQAVPAGIYARQWMEAAGLWPALRVSLAETENVRAALALVSRGETPLGIVYASDAKADPGVAIVAEIDARLHDPVVYPVALVAGRDSAAARAVLAHLKSDAAAAAFEAHGFRVIGGAP